VYFIKSLCTSSLCALVVDFPNQVNMVWHQYKTINFNPIVSNQEFKAINDYVLVNVFLASVSIQELWQ